MWFASKAMCSRRSRMSFERLQVLKLFDVVSAISQVDNAYYARPPLKAIFSILGICI
jgi:hypothetical protein